ncbi:reverse transcriptase/maturase family protein [Allofrancisella inopinata]|uniref:reverse transcriptase/maturase family protein n=1 Tax=Allofrancisella inopinata TaxID=1085647 RepID=UPI001FB7A30D|nr:reverse transcriptase/maturase family protein [Allofrancisella inopinata]
MEKHLSWLFRNRRKSHYNSDYWHFKRAIDTNKENITYINNLLNSGNYFFEPATVINNSKTGEMLCIWGSQVSLVLKTLAEDIKSRYENVFSKNCVSNKLNSGVKQAFSVVNKYIKTHKCIYRTDIKKFYNSINHNILLQKLTKFSTFYEHKVIKTHLDRIEWRNGSYIEIKKGISKSSPLSPVLGCIYLHQLDLAMKNLGGVIYQRYTDDFIIMATTKHKLREAVKIVKQILQELKLEEHPDKTDYRNFNNPNAKPFEFLGVKISRKGVYAIRSSTELNFLIKINQLYEYLLLIIKLKKMVRVDTRIEIEIIKKLLCK